MTIHMDKEGENVVPSMAHFAIDDPCMRNIRTFPMEDIAASIEYHQALESCDAEISYTYTK